MNYIGMVTGHLMDHMLDLFLHTAPGSIWDRRACSHWFWISGANILLTRLAERLTKMDG